MRLARIIGSLTLAAGMLVIAPAPANATLRDTTATCADLVVLGARGSGQSWTSGAIPGFGPELSLAVANARSRVRANGTIRYVGVDYPATSVPSIIAAGPRWSTVYWSSVGKGAKYAMDTINGLVRSCRTTKIALVGVSQGASVVRWAIRDLPSASQARVIVVGLVGDPQRRGFNVSPSEIGLLEDFGSGTLRNSGLLGAGPVLPSGRARAVVSMCHAADPVCNAPVGAAGFGGLSLTVHETYYKSAAAVPKNGMMLYIPLANAGFR
jgi:pimeloyl-ACP methyl ester carboxylesterase